LLIHGFTTSPKEFRGLSDYLANRGISSYALLLPGHGTSPERLSIIKHYQWIEYVEQQIAMLSKEYNEIYLIGNSMGGNLALICAPYSKKIKGIVTLGTPIIFQREKFGKYFLLPLIKSFKIFQDKRYKIKNKKKMMSEKTWSYQSVPLVSLNQLIKIVNLTKKILPSVKKPLLVMQVVRDHLVSKESSSYIISKSSSQTKRIVTIPESYHVFLVDKYADYVNREIAYFISEGR
jgi:carboxylesterase